MGSIPGQETKIPHAVEQLSPLATTRESVSHKERSCVTQQRPHVPQVRPDTAKEREIYIYVFFKLHMFNKKIWENTKNLKIEIIFKYHQSEITHFLFFSLACQIGYFPTDSTNFIL